MKLSDLAAALKLQAQLVFLQAQRGSIASSVRVKMGNVDLTLPDDAARLSGSEIAVTAEAIGAIREAILGVTDVEINRVKGELEKLGVEVDEGKGVAGR